MLLRLLAPHIAFAGPQPTTVFVPEPAVPWANLVAQVGFPIVVSGILLFIQYRQLTEILQTLKEICVLLRLQRDRDPGE